VLDVGLGQDRQPAGRTGPGQHEVPVGGSLVHSETCLQVLSFVYENSEQKADKLVLSVDNWDLKNFDDPVWKKGNLLEVSWGYPGDMAPTRQVVIQKVTGFQVLSIEGHATSVLMNKVARCGGEVTYRKDPDDPDSTVKVEVNDKIMLGN
jgi:hypothetical protein